MEKKRVGHTTNESNFGYELSPPSYLETINKELNSKNGHSERFPQIEVVSPNIPDCSSLTEKEVRQILLTYSKRNGNISKSTIKKMKITKIEVSFVHAYTLETFKEKRQTSWQHQIYRMGRIDDQTLGKMPEVWEIPSPIKVPMFCNKVKYLAVPHSEYIQPCHACSPASKFCRTCSGNNKLKYFLNCKVTWSTNEKSFFSEPTLIPKYCLRKAIGHLVYEKELPNVNPFSYTLDEGLSQACVRLIESHKNKSKDEKVLMQRHQVHLIPVATVSYTHKNQTSQFYLYGNDWCVHFPRFPDSVCSFM